MAADRATVSIRASLLPDEVKTTISGTTIYDINDTGDNNKWVFQIRNVGTGSVDLFTDGLPYYMTDGMSSSVTPETATDADDDVVFIVIKHSGTTDGTTATTNSVSVNLNNQNCLVAQNGNIIIKPNEVWFGRIMGQPLEDFTTANRNEDSSGANVQISVFAICDDGGL